MSAARILIVEDEAIVAKDIQTSLARLGYTVLGARASGEEAVAAARELQPDLILMDIKLKGPLDGIEAAARIRRDREIPVIYLTAFTDDDTLRRATATDAFGYLLKPFEDRELRSTIEMALYKHTMERRLQESREWLEAVLHCIRDAVIATDGQGRIQFMNPMAESLTGWRQPEAIGRKLTDVFCLVRADQGPLGDSDMAAMLEHGSSSQPNDRSVLVSRDGNRIPVAHGAAPIRCARGLLHGVVVSFRDITEHQEAQDRERQLQDRLARGQRMESLGRLAGGVAHQLNGVLGPMLAYPDLIARTLPDDSPARQDLDIVKNSVRKALEVVRDLLTLGRIGHDAMLPLSLNRLVEETLASPAALELQRQAPLVAMHLKLREPLPPVRGSGRLLRDMLLNLLAHAFDALPQGGAVTLATAAERLDAPLAGYELIPPGSYVTLCVRDTGHGIGEAERARLFEPFHEAADADPSGRRSGLGLAVVYAALKEHKGWIDVRSTPDSGSDLVLYLPADESRTAPGEPESAPDFRGHETILVVDDEEEQRLTSARWLRTMGYNVLTAPNGRAAIELFEAAGRTQAPAVDLVLLDMVMADEFDGLDTYRRLQELAPGQKAVIASGFAVTGRIKQAMALGAGQYIQKPYTAEELGRAVRRELDKP